MRVTARRKNLWGGRFGAGPDAMLTRFNDSFHFDRALLSEEIACSTAWAEALARCGALKPAEARRLTRALASIGARPEEAAGDHEDVHSYVEAALAARVGDLASRLHTGRSRNDQVAADLRLYIVKAFDEAERLALGLAATLAKRAEAEASTPMPGYTHMKRAEPVTFGHWCLAYVEMLRRDASRLFDARRRADACPLGSGALAGTPLPIDRARLARELGFSRPTTNSLDAVSDRDAAAEYLFCGAMMLGHLSRLAEDLILFSSDELAFVELPDRLTTGSSRMPHKKNPDLLELTRGHAARAIGDLAGLLALLKGLPLAYNKDLQLDKEPVFRLRLTLSMALPALAALVDGLDLRRDVMRRAASDQAALSTAAADAMAARGLPFRKAHELVGGRLRGKGEAAPAVDLDACLARMSALGGTAPRRVRAAAAAARRVIARRLGEAE